MTKKQTQTAEAIADLKQLLTPGETVYTILKHVSTSGMYRAIDVYVFRDNEPRRITWSVAQAVGYRYDTKHEALGVGGCGMDMGFNVVYNLSRVLFRDGYECVGQNCGSNDHSNGDRNYEPHMHTGDGGYALKQRWM